MDESKQLWPALQQTLPQALCGLGGDGLDGERLGKVGHLSLVRFEVLVLQSVFVHGRDDGSQEGSERASDGLKVLIERIIQEDLIHVTHQMYHTFLLLAW